MSSLERRACATLALIALASLAGIASAAARGEEPRESHEHRQAAGQRQTVRRQPESRQMHGTYHSPLQGVHATEHREASYARERAAVNEHREMVAQSIKERRSADFSVARGPHVTGGDRASEVSHSLTGGGPVRVVRYGNSLSGTVDRTIRPGLVSRTFLSGGHVLYTHVYQRQVWRQFGRSFPYETFVPAVRYPAVYYAWALTAWPRPVAYAWGWQVQPWYPMYGALFTPYPVYTSPDLWMTDYIIAQSMQAAYQAQAVAPTAEPPPLGATATQVPDPGVASLGSAAGAATPKSATGVAVVPSGVGSEAGAAVCA